MAAEARDEAREPLRALMEQLAAIAAEEGPLLLSINLATIPGQTTVVTARYAVQGRGEAEGPRR